MSKSLSKPTIIFHWITGVLFLCVLGLGLYLDELPKGPDKFEIMGIHKSLGLIVLVAASFRIIWRIKEGFIPSPDGMAQWELALSKGVQFLLLIATMSMPISGLMMNIGGGRATEIFGLQLLGASEKNEWVSDAGHFIHVQSVNIIIFILILHVVGALKHQLIAKDGTLSRMLGR